MFEFRPEIKKKSSRSQAVVWADEFRILNLTILNPGPPDSDPFCPPPPIGGPGYTALYWLTQAS